MLDGFAKRSASTLNLIVCSLSHAVDMASLRALRSLAQPRAGFCGRVLWRTHLQHPPALPFTISRYYTPMTEEEQQAEKERVASLTPFQKDQELRNLNRQIAKLELLKGINTGELYTWRGRYKALARDYGIPLVAWYWCVWCSTAVACYGAIHLGGVDVMALVENIDLKFGWHLASKVDPEIGKIGMTLVLNELIEPIRLPIVIVTLKPVVDNIFPPKY